jgi:hypothetical protein
MGLDDTICFFSSRGRFWVFRLRLLVSLEKKGFIAGLCDFSG